MPGTSRPHGWGGSTLTFNWRPCGAILLSIAALGVSSCDRVAAAARPTERRATDIYLPPDSATFQAIVPAGTTLGVLLRKHQLLEAEVAALVRAVGREFDLRRFKAGQRYQFDRYFDGRVREFVYDVDVERQVIARRASSEPTFDVELAHSPIRSDRAVIEGAIDDQDASLIAALAAAGERLELSLAMAEVFAGELDFSSDPQPGDSFHVVVDRVTRTDGIFVRYGPVLAAEYTNAGRVLQAVRFTPPDGKAAYFDAQGRSLTRFFLKSPLKFEPRITSAFSRSRRHPVLNYSRAHNGVDYAAPTGATVATVAGGVVTFAGWTNGGGHTVRVRHANGYESEYLHLSRITVRRLDRVVQGESVGRVGATGLVTGPHLHYGLRRAGAYVNPVREHQSLPPGEPIDAAHQLLFAQERNQLFRLFQPLSLRRAN